MGAERFGGGGSGYSSRDRCDCSSLLFNANSARTGLAAVFVGLPYTFANLPLGGLRRALFGALALISWSAATLLLEPAVLLIGMSGVGASHERYWRRQWLPSWLL